MCSSVVDMATCGPGKLDDLEPVPPHHLHRLGEAGEGDRLGDERVDAEVVASEDVFLGLRGREHDDRALPQGGIRLDLAQSLTTRSEERRVGKEWRSRG